MKYIHLNCDLGEGAGNDRHLMPLISACNIACGGHAGNISSMRATIHLAMEHGVEIGAHPSNPHREGFGRRSLSISEGELRRSIVAQILSLKQLIEAEGGVLRHVKPHGALYHDAVIQEKTAGVLIESLLEFEDPIRLYVPRFSSIAQMAEGHLDLAYEAFADRRYISQSELIPRSRPNALLIEKQQVYDQLIRLYLDQEIVMESGAKIPYRADTFCVHSDTPNALEILQYIQQRLATENIKIQHT